MVAVFDATKGCIPDETFTAAPGMVRQIYTRVTGSERGR